MDLFSFMLKLENFLYSPNAYDFWNKAGLLQLFSVPMLFVGYYFLYRDIVLIMRRYYFNYPLPNINKEVRYFSLLCSVGLIGVFAYNTLRFDGVTFKVGVIGLCCVPLVIVFASWMVRREAIAKQKKKEEIERRIKAYYEKMATKVTFSKKEKEQNKRRKNKLKKDGK